MTLSKEERIKIFKYIAKVVREGMNRSKGIYIVERSSREKDFKFRIDGYEIEGYLTKYYYGKEGWNMDYKYPYIIKIYITLPNKKVIELIRPAGNEKSDWEIYILSDNIKDTYDYVIEHEEEVKEVIRKLFNNLAIELNLA